MSDRRAPIAMRTPISRVRSVTETSMMFMMPMPPTSSEIAAMPTSSSVSVGRELLRRLYELRRATHLEVVLATVGDVVPLLQQRRNRRLRPIHVVGVVDLREDLVDVLRVVQACLGDGERDVDHVILVPQSVGPLGLQHADDAERLAANGNHLPQRLSRRGGEEVIHHGLTDHRYRRPGRVVGVAKPCALGHIPVLDLLHGWRDALHAGVPVLSSGDDLRAHRDDRGDAGDVRDACDRRRIVLGQGLPGPQAASARRRSSSSRE